MTAFMIGAKTVDRGLRSFARLLAAVSCLLLLMPLASANAASVQVSPGNVTLTVNQGSFDRSEYDFFDISWSWGGGLFTYRMEKLSGGNWVSTDYSTVQATSASYTATSYLEYDANAIKALAPGTYTTVFRLVHNMSSASPNDNELTVTLTVLPEAPSASDYTAPAVAYEGVATIDLSPYVTNADAVQIASGPSHGTSSVTGFQVTYTPSPGYFGPDSFTYRAVGPGGVSAPATVSLIVSAPPAPTASPYGAGTSFEAPAAINLSAAVSGVATDIVIVRAPNSGAAAPAGMTVTYTPNAGFHGTDTFEYAAQGPGGMSSPAVVTITVNAPPPPFASDTSSNVPYESAGTAVDLSASIAGVYDSVVMTAPPSHGSASFSGTVATYIPAPGYYGPDSFSYAAVGPGGTSASANVNIVVATPAAPLARAGSTATAFEQPADLDVASLVDGVFSSVTLSTGPSHGTAGFSGTILAYRPDPGFIGVDSLTYTASGPGGTSAPAVITITVAAPPPPVVEARTLSTAYEAPLSRDFADAVSGVVDGQSLTIVASPSNGTAGFSGTVLTYRPNPNFIGSDSLTYTASGPGGTSAPAVVTIAVAAPPPPQSIGAEVEAAFENGSATVDLSALVTGVFDTVEIVSQPAHGSVTIRQGLARAAAMRIVAIYTPAPGFHGEDSFSIRAVGPGGASAPSQVKIKVQPPQVIVRNHSVETLAGASVTIDVAEGAQGGPFVGAAILDVAPSGAGTATTTASRVTFTPEATFDGTATLRYVLSNSYGTSAPGTIVIAVVSRPDPSRDREVIGLLEGQAATARRFADAQILNFSQRLETLRRNRRGANVQGIRIGLRAAGEEQPDSGEPAREFFLAPYSSAGLLPKAPRGPNTEREPSPLSIWTGGYISLGDWKGTATRPGFDFTTSGISSGVDYWFSPNFVAGLGIGYGRDGTEIGGNGTRSDGESWSLAAYGSWQAVENAYLDGLLGYGRLDFDSRRYVTETGGFAEGRRGGDQLFAMLRAGYDLHAGEAYMSPYAGVEMSWTRLDAATESGGHHALTFQQQQLTALNAVLGVTADYGINLSWGTLTPSLRAEWRRTVSGTGAASLAYADWTGGPVYELRAGSESRDRFRFGLGLDADFDRGLSLGFGYDASLAGGGPIGHSFSGRASLRF